MQKHPKRLSKVIILNWILLELELPSYHAEGRITLSRYSTPPCMPGGSFPFPPPGPTFVFNEIFMQFMEFQCLSFKVFQVELILSHKTI